MLKTILFVGAAAVSFPALAQTTPPAGSGAPAPTEQPDTTTTEPAPAPTDPAPAGTTTTPDPTAAPAPTESAPPAGEAAKPAPSSAAATPAQIAQIVDHEFGSYDADKSSDLNQSEFAAWMKKLRTATDPTVDPESEQVKSWVGQAWTVADADKSGAISKEELTAFLSRGA